MFPVTDYHIEPAGQSKQRPLLFFGPLSTSSTKTRLLEENGRFFFKFSLGIFYLSVTQYLTSMCDRTDNASSIQIFFC